MMAYIRGSVKDLQDGVAIVVPAKAAVGYEIRVGPRLRVNWDCELWVWEVFSAEKGATLFGFDTPLDRRVAQRLTGVKGIGPTIAHRVVVNMGADRVIPAIVSGDVEGLCEGAGKGLGPKGANNLIRELKDSFEALSPEGAGSPMLPRITAGLRAVLPKTAWVDMPYLTKLIADNPDMTESDIVRRYLRDLQK